MQNDPPSGMQSTSGSQGELSDRQGQAGFPGGEVQTVQSGGNAGGSERSSEGGSY